MLYTEAFETLQDCIRAGAVGMVQGEPGGGKTAMVRAAARAIGRPLVEESFATMESVDVRGMPNFSPDGASVAWSVPSFVARLRAAAAAGIPPVLFIDEANALSQSMQVCLMQIALEKRAGDHEFPAGTDVVFAGNRQSDRAAAQRMGTALIDRIVLIPVDRDVRAWLAWAAASGIDPTLTAFIMLRGGDVAGRQGLLSTFDPKRPEVEKFATPRGWAECSKFMDLPDARRFRAIKGRIGEGPAAELEGFIRVARELPPILQIISAPDSAKLPADPSGMFAVAVALARAANPANFANVLRYMARVGTDFETACVVDAIAAQPVLAETPAYINWAARNAHVAI